MGVNTPLSPNRDTTYYILVTHLCAYILNSITQQTHIAQRGCCHQSFVPFQGSGLVVLVPWAQWAPVNTVREIHRIHESETKHLWAGEVFVVSGDWSWLPALLLLLPDHFVFSLLPWALNLVSIQLLGGLPALSFALDPYRAGWFHSLRCRVGTLWVNQSASGGDSGVAPDSWPLMYEWWGLRVCETLNWTPAPKDLQRFFWCWLRVAGFQSSGIWMSLNAFSMGRLTAWAATILTVGRWPQWEFEVTPMTKKILKMSCK